MVLKRLISLILVCSFLLPHFAIADDSDKSENNLLPAVEPLEKDFIDRINDFNDGKSGVNRVIARPISKYVLQKMGTPGFIISKYMAYRKLMNQPLCTPSEKLNFAATLLTLAGDITNHVIAWKHKQTLKKEFEGKTGDIKTYLKDHKDILKAPQETGELKDVQLMALDYSIRYEELELKRLKLLSKFKYPALSLYLIANILNAKEALAEGSSFGTYLAKVQACRTALRPAREAKEQATNSAADAGVAGKSGEDDSPWYLKPFLWIGGKIKDLGKTIKGTETYQTIEAGTKKMNLNNSELQEDYGGVSPLSSANYAEEMIVGVISHLKKEKKGASAGVKLRDEAIDIAIRLAVRKVVRLNIESVDGFMRSSVGRNLVYAYNLWVIYTEFKEMQKMISNTKIRIAALKDVRAKYLSTTQMQSYHDDSEREFDDIFRLVLSALISEAYASVADPFNIPPIKMCLGVASCKQPNPFLDKGLKEIFQALPANMQKEHVQFLKSSYSFQQVQLFNQGKISIQQINQGKVLTEIAAYEKEAEQLAKLMDQRKIVPFQHYQKFEVKILNDDYNWYSTLMRPDFNQANLAVKQAPMSLNFNLNSQDSVTTSIFDDLNSDETISQISDLSSAQKNNDVAEVMNSDFVWQDINQQKDQNIWEIISNRYQRKSLFMKVNP